MAKLGPCESMKRERLRSTDGALTSILIGVGVTMVFFLGLHGA